MIKSVHFLNYRGFEDFSLDLVEGTNLLIGDNASGKTTIIRGLAAVLSSFFLGMSTRNTKFLGLDHDDFRIVKSDEHLGEDLPVEVKFTFLDKDGTLRLNSSKGGRTQTKPLSNIKKLSKKFLDDLNGDKVVSLPLICCYSTNIHSSRKISKGKFKEYFLQRTFGYYECLRGHGFLEHWTKRLLVLKEGDKGELEIEGIRKAISRVLGIEGCGVISDIDIRPNASKVFYLFVDGRESETQHLSDGYQRIVNIVLDMSFRCMILNGSEFGVEALEKTKGTVLIDEIDLHLHPSLQSVVLASLRSTFSNIQFIITSHAPLVMSGLYSDNKNVIYRLEYDVLEKLYVGEKVNAYGLDVSKIMEIILNITPRSKEVDVQLSKLFKLIDSDEFVNAKEILENMREKFGDNLPELFEAQSMIEFMEHDSDS